MIKAPILGFGPSFWENLGLPRHKQNIPLKTVPKFNSKNVKKVEISVFKVPTSARTDTVHHATEPSQPNWQHWNGRLHVRVVLHQTGVDFWFLVLQIVKSMMPIYLYYTWVIG